MSPNTLICSEQGFSKVIRPWGAITDLLLGDGLWSEIDHQRHDLERYVGSAPPSASCEQLSSTVLFYHADFGLLLWSQLLATD